MVSTGKKMEWTKYGIRHAMEIIKEHLINGRVIKAHEVLLRMEKTHIKNYPYLYGSETNTEGYSDLEVYGYNPKP